MSNFLTWFFAFFVSTTLVSLIILTPSFISAYKMGIRKYLDNIRLLLKFNKSLNLIDKSYIKISNRTVQFTYQDGSKGRSFTTLEYDYFLPIYFSSTEVYIIYKKRGTLSNSIDFRISKYFKINNKWENKDIVIRNNNQCMITMILYDRFDKKVKKSENKSVKIKDTDDIDTILYEKIKSIDREEKLKKVLGEEKIKKVFSE